MVKIVSLKGMEILDSRGNPTVQAEIVLDDGTSSCASVPSGASTGTREAFELRDGNLPTGETGTINPKRYGGKGVLKAVSSINEELANIVIGMDPNDQDRLDEAIIDCDGTQDKKRLGANAILAVSLVVMKSVSVSRNIELYEYIKYLYGNTTKTMLPVPLLNILNGGLHASNSTDFQEFMIAPIRFSMFSEALRAGAEIYHKLGESLDETGQSTNIGAEGGYAPIGLSNRDALRLITKAIEDAGYLPGEEVFIALDAAATEFYQKLNETNDSGIYSMQREGRSFSSDEMIAEYTELSDEYPIYSIEDGLSEDDWTGWNKLTRNLGKHLQLVGDDLFVTNTKYLQRGISENSANSVLVKLNQVGTVTETLETIKMADEAGFSSIISHRSGETEDTTIADLAVGTVARQIKAGAPARSERVAKYNRLLRIENILGDSADYAGQRILVDKL